MARSTEEWRGATDDAAVPPRVRLRVFMRDKGVCQCGCERPIRPGEPWQTDHKVALINGGANRETNLHSMLADHHKEKTRTDVAQKAKAARVQLKTYGVKGKSRPMAGSKASGWKKTFGRGWVKR
jgi:5-methylcytosine-specific restriction endonuclease McrA